MPALEDDSKVMDVSKPGKGKPVATSRPIVAEVVSEPAVDESVSVSTPVSEPAAPLKSPSAAHKTIEPLNTDAKTEAADETPSEEKAAETPNQAEAASDDAATVDALVSTAETKKEAAKKAEEQAKRDAELQALIDSKKYVVPVSGAKGRNSKARVWGVPLVLIVLITGVYLLADAGVFGSSVKVPFEIIKNESGVSDTARDTPAAASEDETEKQARTDQAKPDESSDEPLAAVTPEARARDTDRKTELKNLQQKLETYFNDNGEYPLSLSGLTPRPSQAELTDDLNAAYSYSSNGQSYTLSAQLENPDDPEAEDGSYKLYSINQ